MVFERRHEQGEKTERHDEIERPRRRNHVACPGTDEARDLPCRPQEDAGAEQVRRTVPRIARFAEAPDSRGKGLVGQKERDGMPPGDIERLEARSRTLSAHTRTAIYAQIVLISIAGTAFFWLMLLHFRHALYP